AHAGQRQPPAGRLPQRLAADHPGRPRAGRARGRRLQRPLAARLRRAVRQAAARPRPGRGRRRAVGAVVPDPRRRHGPHDRAGRGPRRRAAARRRRAGRHRAGPGRLVRGAGTGPGRPHLHARPRQPRRLRPALGRAAPALLDAAADVPPAQPPAPLNRARPAAGPAPWVDRSRHGASGRRYDRRPPRGEAAMSVVTAGRGQQMDGAEAPKPTAGGWTAADDEPPVPPDVAARIVRAVDRSPSTVVTLVNPDLTIAWDSRSARWITGSDPDSRRGDSAVSRIHPDDAHRLVEGLAQLRAAQGHHDYLTTVPEPIRYRFQRFDGTWVVMEATIHNLLGDPEADGLLV